MNDMNKDSQGKDENPTPSKNGGGKGPGNGNSEENKITLTVIVSGTPTTVNANPNQKMKVIAEKALEQTGNIGRPLTDWTLKTKEGLAIDLDKRGEEYDLKDFDQLVMSLEAGVGGC